MNTRQCTKFAHRLTQVLGAGTITRLGRTTGFTHRLREVTPHRMAIALLTSLSCHSTQTLADILRVFNALTDRSVRYKPCHNQLAKHAFPTFTWHLFDLLLDHLVLRVLAPLPGHALRRFDDILLQDGSSFAVVDALQDTFPGRFTTVSPAAVELYATMSLFHDQAIRVHLAPDADGERQFLPAPGDLRRTLILADRGYMDIDYCRHVHHAGGSFIVRFKTGVNPVVIRARVGGRVSGCRGVGKHWPPSETVSGARRLTCWCAGHTTTPRCGSCASGTARCGRTWRSSPTYRARTSISPPSANSTDSGGRSNSSSRSGNPMRTCTPSGRPTQALPRGSSGRHSPRPSSSASSRT